MGWGVWSKASHNQTTKEDQQGNDNQADPDALPIR